MLTKLLLNCWYSLSVCFEYQFFGMIERMHQQYKNASTFHFLIRILPMTTKLHQGCCNSNEKILDGYHKKMPFLNKSSSSKFRTKREACICIQSTLLMRLSPLYHSSSQRFRFEMRTSSGVKAGSSVGVWALMVINGVSLSIPRIYLKITIFFLHKPQGEHPQVRNTADAPGNTPHQKFA